VIYKLLFIGFCFALTACAQEATLPSDTDCVEVTGFGSITDNLGYIVFVHDNRAEDVASKYELKYDSTLFNVIPPISDSSSFKANINETGDTRILDEIRCDADVRKIEYITSVEQ